MIGSPDSYIGKKLVYVESGQMCLTLLAAVEHSENGFKAAFTAAPSQGVSCQLRQIRKADEDVVLAWSSEPPFDQQWDVTVGPKEIFFEPDYWQASLLWGGGFRVFFNPAYVERFIQQDISWLEEFYNGDRDDE